MKPGFSAQLPLAHPGGPAAEVSQAPGRFGRPALRGVIGAAVVLLCSGALIGTASAAPGETSGGTTDANVGVTSAIALTALTPSFTLTGLPGATVTGVGAVTFNVATNNLAGYAVTVVSETPTMVGTGTNPDSIPIADLTVQETGGAGYAALSDTTPVTVHSQSARSAEGGDSLSNDYQLVVPFVNEDTYTATLDYLATTL
jgi:hypothetical protein